MALNLIKGFFKGIGTSAVNKILDRYDEPTYQTFRVLFSPTSTSTIKFLNEISIYDRYSNVVNNTGSNTSITNYDVMPHPLLNNYDSGGGDVQYYSTVDYLRNCNENSRADMLIEFINLLNTIQFNYPYYFQKISGTEALTKIDPTSGQRVKNNTYITIDCLEALDGRINYLNQLYRRIAWDDVYQRWILPDMMRFFKLHIIVTEFRTFHERRQLNAEEDYLAILNNISPTYMITCDMCEFVLPETQYYKADYDVMTGDMVNNKLVIKCGNIREKLWFPIFRYNNVVGNSIDAEGGVGIIDDDTINTQHRIKTMATNISGSTIAQRAAYYDNVGKGNITLPDDDRYIAYSHKTGYYVKNNNLENGLNSRYYALNGDLINTEDIKSKFLRNAATTINHAVDNALDSLLTRAKTFQINGVSYESLKDAIDNGSITSLITQVKRGLTANDYTTLGILKSDSGFSFIQSPEDMINNAYSELMSGYNNPEEEIQSNYNEVNNIGFSTNLVVDRIQSGFDTLTELYPDSSDIINNVYREVGL